VTPVAPAGEQNAPGCTTPASAGDPDGDVAADPELVLGAAAGDAVAVTVVVAVVVCVTVLVGPGTVFVWTVGTVWVTLCVTVCAAAWCVTVLGFTT
jgi:hypothetical protein